MEAVYLYMFASAEIFLFYSLLWLTAGLVAYLSLMNAD